MMPLNMWLGWYLVLCRRARVCSLKVNLGNHAFVYVTYGGESNGGVQEINLLCVYCVFYFHGWMIVI